MLPPDGECLIDAIDLTVSVIAAPATTGRISRRCQSAQPWVIGLTSHFERLPVVPISRVTRKRTRW